MVGAEGQRNRPTAGPPAAEAGCRFSSAGVWEATDRADEYCRISSTTIEIAVKKLVVFIGNEFGGEYLRPPNDAELDVLLKRNAERGMPGCIGSLDCSQWEWKNCPKGQAGLYQNRKGRRAVVMETVCDEDLYIWHLFVGCPGSMNDLNVMQQSPLYQDITAGIGRPVASPSLSMATRARFLLPG